MKEKTRVKPVWQRLMLRTAVVLSLAGTLAVPGQIQAQDNGIDIRVVDLAVPEGDVDGTTRIQYERNGLSEHRYTSPAGPHDYVLGNRNGFGELFKYKDVGSNRYIFCLEPTLDPVGDGQTITQSSYTLGSKVELASVGIVSDANMKKVAVVMDHFYKGNQSDESYALAQFYIWEILGYAAPTESVGGLMDKYEGYKNSITMPSNIRIAPGSTLYSKGSSTQTLGYIRGTAGTGGGTGTNPNPNPGNPGTPYIPEDTELIEDSILVTRYETIMVLDSTLEPGTQVTVQKGVNGQTKITKTYVNNVLVNTQSTILVNKVDRIIHYNNKVVTTSVETEKLPYGTIETFDERLAPGERIRVVKGIDGLRYRTQRYVNGIPDGPPSGWVIDKAPITERWIYNDNQYITRQEPRNTAFKTIRRVNYNLEPGAYVEVQPGKTGREYRENTWLARADGTLIRLVSYGPQWIVDTLPQDRIIEYNPTPVIEKIPFETIIVQDPNRWDDEEPEEIQPGIEGEKEIYRHMDGSVTEAVKTNPQDRIIVVGTKPAYGAAEYTSEEIAPYETEVIESREHDIYYRETIQQGVNGRKYVVYSRETYRGEWIENSRPVEVSSEIIEAPINEIIIQGTKAPSLD